MRRHLLALVAVSLPLLGCGDSSPTPLATITAAANLTREAETARLAMNITAQNVEIEADGEIDFDGPRMHMTMDLGAALAGAGEIEFVSDEVKVFMRSPLFQQAGQVDTPWVSFDLRELAKQAGGVDLSQLQQTNQDPTQALAYLKGASDDVRELGEEEVRGTDTTHYRATVDLRKAYEQAKGITNRERFEALIDQIGVDEVDMDLWIDDEGRARRMAWDQPMPGSGEMSLEMEMFDFGTEVSIEPPPASQVTDITHLVSGARPPG